MSELRLFERVKEAHDLDAFFEDVLKAKAQNYPQGRRYHVCPVPSCGTSKHESHKVRVRDGQWRCHKCGSSGSVIDAAAHAWGMSQMEAAKRLAGDRDRPMPAVVRQSAPEESDVERDARYQALQEVFTILQVAVQENKDDQACLAYLIGDRKIPEEVIRSAQARGILGFLPSEPVQAVRFLVKHVGKELLVKAGLWKEGAKMPGIVYRPIISFMPGGASAEFRLARKPRDQKENKALRYGPMIYPWYWRGETLSVMVVEGVIDMMSAVALGYKGHIIAVPGCNNWKSEWFQKLHARLGAKRYYIALDNDESPDNPGQTWARKMAEVMQQFGLPHVIKDLPPGRDINDLLRAKAA